MPKELQGQGHEGENETSGLPLSVDEKLDFLLHLICKILDTLEKQRGN